MPPPNANDDLHVGHVRFVAIEDILIRYHRMKGDPTLWLPGADHAGIETQFVFEKKLKEQGKTRFDYDRETLYKMIWDYVQKNKTSMENQLRAMGSSCDWSRNKFTLDPEIVKIVYRTFKKLADDGLVYRGERLVNYCTRCGTAYSELEVDHLEKQGELYILDYGAIKVATTRPETIFADTAIAVNPSDNKYRNLIGKTAVIPLINKNIPIITDEAVEMGVGTGALKVTPGHDFTDWEIGERHRLDRVTVIGRDGRMTAPAPEKYTGLFVNEARKAVVDDLTQAGKLVETKTHTFLASVCYRCKNPIEPLPSPQWFIKVAQLASLAKKAVADKRTSFTAEKFEKIYNHWLDNLRDWNISRQIVWGIQIPAWECTDCHEWVITSGETPESCKKCQGKKLIRDEDTFDTWFSSGQWPFATLKTTRPGDFAYFYPTTIMETAYDILPFWVMRMMMLGIYITGEVPFERILIHGLVRDKQGQKISKSKGNVINPLEMTGKYGTDALRMALIWGTLTENDISLSEDNIRGQKNFANKIWNVARYVVAANPNFQNTNHNQISNYKSQITNKDDLWIVAELEKLIKSVTENLEKFRIGNAAEEIYEFIWHKFADIYIEKTKGRKEEASPTLRHVFINCLKLLHPFMPFVTEAVWGELERVQGPALPAGRQGSRGQGSMLINSRWPEIRH
jgi:valyl-tRNA synthetase